MALPSLRTLLVLAGLGQLALAAGSLAIPRVLGWREDTAKLKPLTRQVFWTYAGYIWSFNVAFGLVSSLAPAWLLDRTPLAGAVAAVIAIYWLARVVIQFVYFDRSSAPPGLVTKLGEIALVGLFVYCAVLYGVIALRSLGLRAS